MRPRPEIAFSVVSHRHGSLMRLLLADLAAADYPPFELHVTINVAEPEDYLCEGRGLDLRVHRNARPLGFGENHNAALASSQARALIVLNPDLRLRCLDLRPILAELEDPRTGVCAPLVVTSQGHVEDSARRFPTIARLAARRFLGRRAPDYDLTAGVQSVDWVAGMFMAFRNEAFRAVGGFDPGYFLYCEDVDICRRLRRQGYAVMVAPETCVVHDARRDSHRTPSHMFWHVQSMVRYLVHAGRDSRAGTFG